MVKKKNKNSALATERAQVLLKNLVECYISTGQPVGSRTLAKDTGIALSPATIRNVMSDLEDLGLIHAPHTSAGRVPTVKGYRLFIDNLLTVKPITGGDIEQLRQQLSANLGHDEVIKTASTMLSNVTKLTGIVTLPKHEYIRLQHIEFLRLAAKRILVILVINGEEVQNRVIDTQRDFQQDELQQIANYLNTHFSGQALHDIREQILTSMQQSRDALSKMMQDAMNIADKVLDIQQNPDYVIAGETNLMSYAEMANMDKLRQLFEAFSQKRDLLHILDKASHAEGMQIFIGEESGYKVLDDCSVVSAPYIVDNEVIGVLGVIGPTRMAYDRVIPIVDLTAKLLSTILRPD